MFSFFRCPHPALVWTPHDFSSDYPSVECNGDFRRGLLDSREPILARRHLGEEKNT
jgi:hypothetical protein